MDKQNNMMHIALCSDSNYAMPVGVAMISICENNREEPITFHFVLTDEGLSEEKSNQNLQPLKDIAAKYGKDFILYHMNAEQLAVFECKGSSYISTTAFARIFLPNLVSNSISKILYLDGDLIVNQSLKPLWDTSLPPNCPLAAVPDFNMNISHQRFASKLADGITYFNSGVLLMNLDVWRAENLTKQISDAAIEYQFPLLDQDSINYVLQNRIKRLPFTYNGQILAWFAQANATSVDMQTYSEIKHITEEPPVIIHYLSANKPWKEGRCPWREYWDRYKNISIWKNLPRQPLMTTFERTEVFPAFIEAYWGDTALMQRTLEQILPFFYACHHFKNKIKVMNCFITPLKWSTWLLEKIYTIKAKI